MVHIRIYSETFQQLIIASRLALIKMCVSKKSFFFFFLQTLCFLASFGKHVMCLAAGWMSFFKREGNWIMKFSPSTSSPELFWGLSCKNAKTVRLSHPKTTISLSYQLSAWSRYNLYNTYRRSVSVSVCVCVCVSFCFCLCRQTNSPLCFRLVSIEKGSTKCSWGGNSKLGIISPFAD